MDRILLDTDVILDFFFDRKPFGDFSARVIALSETKKIKCYVTPVIVSNLYYLLRKTASHAEVIRKLSQFLTITEVLTMDRAVVNHALRSDFKDFEDALQYNTALQNGKIRFILTRNLKDYKLSSIAVTTPENYLQLSVFPS